jgi:hypothetical protein
MDYVDVYVDGAPIAHTYGHTGGLATHVAFKRSPGALRVRERECAHGDVRLAFAYSRGEDEYWPIAYCDACRTILRGREPDAFRPAFPTREDNEQHVAARRWRREWPKPGRPRARTPPASTVWPDAA